jgi:hypothetical protein
LRFFSRYRKLGLDLVPRIGPLAVNPVEVGIVALHNFHSSSDENTKNTSVSGWINLINVQAINVILSLVP